MMAEAFIVCCIALAAFLVWLWSKQRKLSALLKFSCVVCVISGVVAGQDDGYFSEPRTLVFPEPMMQAEAALANWYYNDSDHMIFLSDSYWPVPLNNTTTA